MNKKVYLGDGAYASFDGVRVVLTTENGIKEKLLDVFFNKEPLCVLKNVKCDITNTGNIVLSERCYAKL